MKARKFSFRDVFNRLIQKPIQTEPFTPPSDPYWWGQWHNVSPVDYTRRTQIMDREEQAYGFEIRKVTGIALDFNESGALVGNEVSGALRLRGQRVIEQPAEQTVLSGNAISTILAAGRGLLQK